MKGQLVQRNEAPELYDFAVKNNLIKSETDWQEQKLYGFFSSGDNETTFRLPLYVGYKTIGYDETQHTLGKPLDPALPNIKGTSDKAVGIDASSGGAFITASSRGSTFQGGSHNFKKLEFNASWVSAIYRDETNTVQTPDIPENWVIKYKS